MKRHLAALLAAALSFSAPAFAGDDWIAVSAADGKYHFRLPVVPETETTNDTEDGIPVTITTYVAASDQLVASASFTEYRSDTAFINLSIFTTAMVKGFEAELIRNDSLPYQRGSETMQGALLVLKKDTFDCKLRVAIDRLHAYTLMACTEHNSGNDAMIERALASFVIDP